MVTAKLTGIEEFDRIIDRVGKKPAKSLARSVVGKMGNVFARSIRAHIPPSVAASQNLERDKGIGYRTTAAKISTITEAKVGVSVGRAAESSHRKVSQKTGRPEAAKTSRAGRKGVGVSASNLMWFALGTDERFTGAKWVRVGRKRRGRLEPTGNPIHYTGRIDARKWGGFVQRGYAAAQNEALQAAREVFIKRLDEMRARGLKDAQNYQWVG